MTIAVTVKVAAERVVSAAVPPRWTRTLGRWVVDPGGRVIIELLALPPYPEDTTQSLTATPLSSSEPGVVPGDRQVLLPDIGGTGDLLCWIRTISRDNSVLAILLVRCDLGEIPAIHS